MSPVFASKSSFNVAVVQAGPVGFDKGATIRKVADLTRQAAARDARLVCFPEAFVSAYPKGAMFDSFVGGRTMEGREAFRRYYDSAIELPGPEQQALGRIARDNEVHLVIGVIERSGGTLYCSVLFFDPSGAYLGKRRKLMPTGTERLMWGFGDGSTLPVFDTDIGKIGAVICWENYMPMLRMAMYAKGIEIYCAPTLDERESWIASMRHIACEGRCFVLSACQATRRSDFPDDFDTRFNEGPDQWISRGGSCIIDPFGNFLAGPMFDSEEILIASVDPAMLARGKFDFDVAGHYARPDVFSLRVNERPMRPVVFDAPASAQASFDASLEAADATA